MARYSFSYRSNRPSPNHETGKVRREELRRLRMLKDLSTRQPKKENSEKKKIQKVANTIWGKIEWEETVQAT